MGLLLRVLVGPVLPPGGTLLFHPCLVLSAGAGVAWFGQDRAAITVPYRGTIEAPVELGDMVVTATTGAVARNVNSPVTSIGYDCLTKGGRVMVQTNFAELDFVRTFFDSVGA